MASHAGGLVASDGNRPEEETLSPIVRDDGGVSVEFPPAELPEDARFETVGPVDRVSGVGRRQFVGERDVVFPDVAGENVPGDVGGGEDFGIEKVFGKLSLLFETVENGFLHGLDVAAQSVGGIEDDIGLLFGLFQNEALVKPVEEIARDGVEQQENDQDFAGGAEHQPVR